MWILCNQSYKQNNNQSIFYCYIMHSRHPMFVLFYSLQFFEAKWVEIYLKITISIIPSYIISSKCSMPPFDKYPCKNRRCPTEGHYYPRALIPSLYPLPLWSISKNNTIWHTDKRTDVWSQPSFIYTQIFNPKKTGFSPHKYISHNFFDFCLPLSYATFQCGP